MKPGDKFIGISQYVKDSVWEIIDTHHSMSYRKSKCVLSNRWYDKDEQYVFGFSDTNTWQPYHDKSDNFKIIYDILNS